MIPNDLSILSYVHCGKCLKEKPNGTPPREWAQHEVGFTKEGIQIWCRRHECNVLHIDFEGQKHPANLEAICAST